MAKKVVLDWTDPSPTTYVNQLEIWRKLDGGTYAHIGGAQLGDETYDDESGVIDITKYYYEVRAYNIDRKYSLIENNITITGFLLDKFPGAEAAYSLRKLKTGISYGIEIRRSSDNATTGVQVYSNGDSIDLSSIVSDGGVSLSTWVGSNSAYIKTWYDQSGNSVDALNVIGANQPILINSGSLVTVNSKSAVDFTSSATWLQTSTQSTISQPITRISVSQFSITNIVHYIQDGTSLRNVVGNIATANARIYAGIINDYGNTHIIDTQYLHFASFNGSSSQMYLDGTGLGTKNIGTQGYDGVTIGAAAATSSNLDGLIQEVIVYGDNQESNRTAIETDINDHYSIY